jgi:uncharacterized iron-regulated membrane protein
VATSLNQRGQALIESVLSYSLITLLFFIFATVVWLGLVRVEADFIMHEFLVCKESQTLQQSQCSSQLKKALQELPTWVQYKKISESHSRNKRTISIDFQILKKTTMHMSKQIPLPLGS